MDQQRFTHSLAEQLNVLIVTSVLHNMNWAAVPGVLYHDKLISKGWLDRIYVDRVPFVWPQTLTQQENGAEGDPTKAGDGWTSANHSLAGKSTVPNWRRFY